MYAGLLGRRGGDDVSPQRERMLRAWKAAYFGLCNTTPSERRRAKGRSLCMGIATFTWTTRTSLPAVVWQPCSAALSPVVVGALVLLAWRERRGTPTTPASLSPGFEELARCCISISACCCGGFWGSLGMRWQHITRALWRPHSLDAGFDISGQAGIVWLGSSHALGRWQWQYTGEWVPSLVLRVDV